MQQAQLDAVGADSLVDLPALMPGVEITNYEDNTELFVRGIGSNANTELGDPAIAPHLDDVYVPRPRGLGVAFFDIERVEVNVGPQGTVRGRNALGGSINIVSRKPKLDTFDGYAEYAIGNYDQQELRGALNVPLGKIAAARLAVYSSQHDEYVRNTGPLNNLLGWESGDDVGARAHFLLQPSDKLSVLLSGDYLSSKGTGSRGVDFFNAASQGRTYNDFDDPRKVNQVGFSPVQGHGSLGCGAQRDLSHRLVQRAIHRRLSRPALSQQPVDERPQLRLRRRRASDGDPRQSDESGWPAGGRLHCRALLRQLQRADLGCDFGEPHARAALHFAGQCGALHLGTRPLQVQGRAGRVPRHPARLLDRSRVPGIQPGLDHRRVEVGLCGRDLGSHRPLARDRRRSLFGREQGARRVQLHRRLQHQRHGHARRHAGLSHDRAEPLDQEPGCRRRRREEHAERSDRAVPGRRQDVRRQRHAGRVPQRPVRVVERVPGTVRQLSGLGFSFGGATVQHGENSDNYVDWRFRVGYDLTDNNLVYLLVATGNKAPSFNDTIDLDPGPAEELFTPPVGPEKNTMFEIGSKNTLDVGGQPLVLNASAYYFLYKDQVFSTVVGTELLDNDPNNDAGCLDSDPGTACSNVTLNQNVGESHNMGVQLDAAYQFANGFNIAGTLLWQDTEYKDGSIVSDGRRASPAGGALLIDLGGNELPRTPPLTLNLRIGQDYEISTGTLDWIASATYKSSYFLTGFNGGSGENGGREVTAVDSSGVATTFGAELLRLRDEVDAYTHLDIGVGYSHGEGNLRVEAFCNNVTDEAHGTQAIIDTGTQEFVFNPPRTYGLRMRVNF
jgi:outer membrane receptor protein involved in Fe transport